MGPAKYNPESIREAFQFLVDEFGYTIIRDEELFHETRPYAYLLEFVGNERRIHLNHDYKENFFYFKIIRGLETKFPNDRDFENITPFFKVFISADPTMDPNSLQPSEKTCAEAAQINAQLLREHASEILQGNEWV